MNGKIWRAEIEFDNEPLNITSVIATTGYYPRTVGGGDMPDSVVICQRGEPSVVSCTLIAIRKYGKRLIWSAVPPKGNKLIPPRR